MSDVTQILNAIEEGDPQAAEKLLPLVYEELRKLARHKMAQESPDHTLQATALVHEAYIRLVGSNNGDEWDNRGHFFSAAAEAMRRILINRARDRNRIKRNGRRTKIDLDKIEIAFDTPDDDLLALDDAIERLAIEHTIGAALVKLRFFSGLSIKDCAATLSISSSTADRYWAFARAWLYDALRSDGNICVNNGQKT